MTRAAALIGIEQSLLGHPYQLGAKWAGTAWPAPRSPIDCSGIQSFAERKLFEIYPTVQVQTAAGPLPVHEMLARFEGSWRQGAFCRPVAKALALGPTGAGLFLFLRPKETRHGHVALCCGWGKTIEARGGHGVVIVGAAENAKRLTQAGWWVGKADWLHVEVDS